MDDFDEKFAKRKKLIARVQIAWFIFVACWLAVGIYVGQHFIRKYW